MGNFVAMPKLDVTIAECVVSEWHVNTGDTVAAGDPLFTMESGKAADEVAAPCGGVVTLLVNEQDEVEVGTPVAFIGTPSEVVPHIPDKLD